MAARSETGYFRRNTMDVTCNYQYLDQSFCCQCTWFDLSMKKTLPTSPRCWAWWCLSGVEREAQSCTWRREGWNGGDDAEGEFGDIYQERVIAMQWKELWFESEETWFNPGPSVDLLSDVKLLFLCLWEAAHRKMRKNSKVTFAISGSLGFWKWCYSFDSLLSLLLWGN